MTNHSGLQSPPSLFFILGRGRSGTTLLSRILSAHSQVTVAPEGFFIMSLWPKYRNVKWSSNAIDSFCDDLHLENRIKTWELPKATLKKEILAASSETNLTFQYVCRLVYKVYAENLKGPVVWVGDKNPHYALFTNDIMHIFPEAPVIYLSRDYLTNIQSYQNVPFDLQDSVALAYRWKMYNDAIINGKKGRDNNFYNLPFENLLNDPQEELSAVCKFLGIPYEPEMLSFHQNEPANFYGKDSPWFDKLSNPINPGESKKEVDLPKSAMPVIHKICLSTAQQLGYTNKWKSLRRLSFVQRLYLVTGFLKAWGMVFLEKLLFYYLPLPLKMFIVNKYREGTGGRI